MVNPFLLGGAALCILGMVCAPALAGAPFRTDDPESVDYQHWEFDLFSTGIHVPGATVAALPGLEANYGAAPNLQLHVLISLGYNSVSGNRSGFALGDVEVGAKFRFLSPSDEDWFPQAAVFPLVEVPAGNQKLGFSSGHVQIFLPVWLQKDFDPWSIYGGGGYWISPGFGNRNSWFYGVALWRSLGDSLRLGVEIFHQTKVVTVGRDTTGFSLGAIYDFSEKWHLLGSVGTGLQNSSSTNQFSYYAGVQLTF